MIEMLERCLANSRRCLTCVRDLSSIWEKERIF